MIPVDFRFVVIDAWDFRRDLFEFYPDPLTVHCIVCVIEIENDRTSSGPLQTAIRSTRITCYTVPIDLS